MCRAALNYKSHWVCLHCQLSFKREGYGSASTRDEALVRIFRCSHCRQPLDMVGRDFRVPKRRDNKEWETLRQLIANDYHVLSRCCDGPGPYPTHWKQVPEFLASRRQQNPGERLAQQFMQRKP